MGAARLTLFQKGILVLSVPLLLQVSFLFLYRSQFDEFVHLINRDSVARDVATGLQWLSALVAMRTLSSVAYSYSKDYDYKKASDYCGKQIQQQLDTLPAELRSTPQQKQYLDIFRKKVNDWLAYVEANTAGSRPVDFKDPSIKTAWDQLFRTRHKLFTTVFEKYKLTAKDNLKAKSELRDLVSWAVVANILVAVALMYWFSITIASRISVLAANTRHVARREPLEPPLSGSDELVELDKVFREMTVALEEAARYKQEMVAMVSHDLRSPLTSVQASLTLLEAGAMGELSEKANREVGIAQRNVDRLISFINDLLDIEKLESGNFVIEARPMELMPLFDDVDGALSMMAEKNKVKLEIVPTDARVEADPDRILQVLTNLASNDQSRAPGRFGQNNGDRPGTRGPRRCKGGHI